MNVVQKKLLLLPCLLLLVVSCSQDNLAPDYIMAPDDSANRPAVELEKGAAGETGYCDPVFHNRMEEYLDNDAGVFFHLSNETIAWDAGGVLDATPSGWPEGYEIKLIIPQYCVATDYPGYESVNFGIAVPVAGPGPGVSSVPFHFYPDGIWFQVQPTLIVSWPPWAGTPTSEILSLVTIRTVIHEGDVHYVMPDAIPSTGGALAQGAPVPPGGWTPEELSTDIEFPVPHFSRWEIVDGDESDDDDTGGFLPAAGSTDQTCWTEFEPDEPDPLDPVPMLR